MQRKPKRSRKDYVNEWRREKRTALPLLEDVELARFVQPGMSAADAMRGSKRGKRWWYDALDNAEDDGLIFWSRETNRWHLTEKGRARVLDVA